MHSKTYQRFLDSMVMDFDKWHDGTGYDLKILKQLEPGEKASIEKLLIKNLEQDGNWRDVEALAALGTAQAWAAVERAKFHNETKVRKYALRISINRQDSNDMSEKDLAKLEELVITAVKHGDFEIAEKIPTMGVKKALLDSIPGFKSEVRVSAAAFLLYLCDQAPEPFDWSQRSFFLLFGKDDPRMFQHAWEHLRKRTGL